MQIIVMLLLTFATLAAAIYAHYRIPYHTSSVQHRWLAHGFLVVLGIAFGWVVSREYSLALVMNVLVFLSAFGVVHVPAAGILFLKRQQKSE